MNNTEIVKIITCMRWFNFREKFSNEIILIPTYRHNIYIYKTIKFFS